MIRKILKLKNIGLLQDACPVGAIDLSSVTAIYAENGRGKTMLAAVLRACQLADPGRMNARKTIDSADQPEADFLLETGSHVEFKTNAWTGIPPEIAVFDAEFVEQNVFSGFEVRPEQRQSLLEFALGDQTVALKKKVEQLTQDIKTQTSKRAQAEKTLSGYTSPFTLPEFIGLQPVVDAHQQIDALQKRSEAAKSAQQLSARQDPVDLEPLAFDVPPAIGILSKTLLDVETSAEAVVRAHLAKHPMPGFEDWVSRGQGFIETEECPFCGQKINGLDLVKAYRSHFNKAYSELKAEVSSLGGKIASALADSKIVARVSSAATNAARIEAWKDQIELSSPVLDGESLKSTLQGVRETLLALASAKEQQPLTAVGTQEAAESSAGGIKTINESIATYNTDLALIRAKISDFKKKLTGDNPQQLQTEIKKLEAAIKRQLPGVVAVIADYQTAEAERKKLDAEKTSARGKIDALMAATLEQYQIRINSILNTLGAEFSIEQLKTSYSGSGEPRSEYGLLLRNKSVKLGSRGDMATGQCFANVLSDADKRTLAFAFFLARLHSDPQLSETVVVLDDPISSLDRNRRRESGGFILRLATRCKQLIVLSHDAHFVREFRDGLADLRPTAIVPRILRIKRVHNGYSAFDECDIDDICSSEYYRNHKMVADYVDGRSVANTRDVAKAIRPMLEGYYYRRFPTELPRKLTFGQIIGRVNDPTTTGPLINLRPVTAELDAVNQYASQFHHDTNPNSDSVQVVDGELLLFARRALALIYQDSPTFTATAP